MNGPGKPVLTPVNLLDKLLERYALQRDEIPKKIQTKLYLGYAL
jgi:hypothetical protein